MTRPSTARLIPFLDRFFLLGALLRAGGMLASLALGPGVLFPLFLQHVLAGALNWLLLRSGRLNAAILLMGVEISILSIRLVWLLGTAPLFHVYGLVLVPFPLLFTHLSPRVRLAMMLLPLAGALALAVLPWTPEPVLMLSPQARDFWSFANLVIFMGVCMGIMHYQMRALREQTARAEALARQRRRLVADLSHELKTPLASILAKVQSILSRPREPEAYREALRLCERNARYLNQLTLRMLELLQSGRDQSEARQQETDLAALLHELKQDLLLLARERGFDLEVCTPPPPLRLCADPLLLAMILRNLASNALLHAQGGTRLLIRFEPEPQPAFLVEDNGPGLPEPLLPDLFEPFTRGDPARGRREGSVGLGLAIAREAAEALGAELTADNRPGGGARFALRFPSPA